MSSARFKQKLARLIELDWADKWLLLRAIGWLLVARLMLVAMPFRRLATRLSTKIDTSHAEPDEDLLRRVGYATAAAANNVPWRSDCFPQSIAARMLLKRHGYGSTIHIGVDRTGEEELAAHAWLTCGETIVTGGAERHRYVEIHRLGE